MTRGLITQGSVRRAVEANINETAIVAVIVGYLRAQRIPHTITEAKRSFNERGQQVRRVNPGWPDITACHAGHLVGIECKRPVGGRLSYIQAVELDKLFRAGGLIVIARSLDDVIRLLDTKQVSQATKDEIAAVLAKGPTRK